MMSRASASCEHLEVDTKEYIANALRTRDFEPDALPDKVLERLSNAQNSLVSFGARMAASSLRDGV